MGEFRGSYNPEQNTIVVNGHVITDWNSCVVSYANDRWTGAESGSGTVYRGKNPSQRGEMVLTMPTVNAHTGFLDNLALSDDTFPIVVLDESGSARTMTSSRCWITKTADMNRKGSADTEEEWRFGLADLSPSGQGDPNDDIQAMPVGA